MTIGANFEWWGPCPRVTSITYNIINFFNKKTEMILQP